MTTSSAPTGGGRRTALSLITVVVVAAVFGGLGWLFLTPKGNSAPGAGGPPGGFAIPVEVAPVKLAASHREIQAIGTLRSNESVTIRPEATGRIVAIPFSEGQKVRKGQVLVQLDASVQRAELAQAQAALALAKANFDRADELMKRGAGTGRALDEARAKLRNDEAAVNLAQARLEKYTLVAPFDGILGLRRVSVGDYVAAGAEIVNLEMIDPLKVDFRVPEIFLAAVRTGQKIEIAADAFPGKTFAGEVYAIDPLIDAAGRSIVIRAGVPNPNDALRPGLFVRVTLPLATREDARFIPEQALMPVGDAHFVYRLTDAPAEAKVPPNARLATMTKVTLGERRKGEVEVLDGLGSGDTVVTGGILKLRDGTPVMALPDSPAAQVK